MLTWISRLFEPKGDRVAEIQAIAQQVLPFLGSAKSQVDQRYLMTPNKHVLMYCFACGCIDVADKEMASRLDETAKLAALFHVITATAKNSDARDTSAMHGRCIQLLATEEGLRARATGNDCFSRWQAGDKSTSQVLGKYLASLPESPAIPNAKPADISEGL